jgi:hypothetical protein
LQYSLTLFFLSALMIKSGATGDSDSDQELFGYVLLFLIFVGPLFIFWNLFGASIRASLCQSKQKTAGGEVKKSQKELEKEARDKKQLDEAAAKFEKRKLKIRAARKLKKKEKKEAKAAAAADAGGLGGGVPEGGVSAAQRGQLAVATKPPQQQPVGASPVNGGTPVVHEHLHHLHHHGHHHHHQKKVHVPHTKKARHEQRRQRLAEAKAAGEITERLIFLFFSVLARLF